MGGGGANEKPAALSCYDARLVLNPVTEYIYLSWPIAVKRPTTIEFVHPPVLVPFLLSRGHLFSSLPRLAQKY